MGTYIHAYAERRSNGQWFPASLSGLVTGDDHPAKLLDGQNYTLFGWLADVRNYAKVPPLSLARGLPADVSEEIAHLADNAARVTVAANMVIPIQSAWARSSRTEKPSANGSLTTSTS